MSHPSRRLAGLLVIGAFLILPRPSLAEEDNAEKAPETPEMRVHIARPDGSKMKRLTDLEEYHSQGSPTWSQDGKLIAFDAWRPQDGEDNTDARIVVVNADGSDPRILCDGAMPSFSPRAKRIVFSRYSPNRGVWVMSSEGPDKGLALLDESGWGADWSPDGTKILYATYGSSGANFVVLDIIEGERRLLFDENNPPYSSLYWNFAWSPDGKRIVFKGAKGNTIEVGIVDARGAEHGLVTRAEGPLSANVAWRPDGKRILITKHDPELKRAQLFYLDPDGEAPPKRLPEQNGTRNNTAATYSPNGEKLAISVRSAK